MSLLIKNGTFTYSYRGYCSLTKSTVCLIPKTMLPQNRQLASVKNRIVTILENIVICKSIAMQLPTRWLLKINGRCTE